MKENRTQQPFENKSKTNETTKQRKQKKQIRIERSPNVQRKSNEKTWKLAKPIETNEANQTDSLVGFAFPGVGEGAM